MNNIKLHLVTDQVACVPEEGQRRCVLMLVTFVMLRARSQPCPPCDQTNPDLKEAGEELMEALESAFIRQAFPRVKARVEALERRIAALEKKSQEAARSPEASKKVVQQIAALRKSLEDKSSQEVKGSSSKEEELVLVRPVKGVDKEGCLILGDPKLLRADALKS